MPHCLGVSGPSWEHWQRARCVTQGDLNGLQVDGAFRYKAHPNPRALLLFSQKEAVIRNRYNLKFQDERASIRYIHMNCSKANSQGFVSIIVKKRTVDNLFYIFFTKNSYFIYPPIYLFIFKSSLHPTWGWTHDPEQTEIKSHMLLLLYQPGAPLA